MTNKQNKMFPKQVGLLNYIERVHRLENIICDLKEVLEFYGNFENYVEKNIGNNAMYSDIEIDNGQQANKVLREYNQSFNDLYDIWDKELEDWKKQEDLKKKQKIDLLKK